MEIPESNLFDHSRLSFFSTPVLDFYVIQYWIRSGFDTCWENRYLFVTARFPDDFFEGAVPDVPVPSFRKYLSRNSLCSFEHNTQKLRSRQSAASGGYVDGNSIHFWFYSVFDYVSHSPIATTETESVACFENAGNIGLTFAAIGYIWAITIGLLLIKFLKKKYGIEQLAKKNPDQKASKKGVIKIIKDQPCAGELTTDNSAIDGFTYQIALVMFVYLITFITLKGVEFLFNTLINNEEISSQLISLLWGMHFIFASLLAILTRKIMHRVGWGNVINNGLMTRISGSSLDFMVTAAIAAISISIFLDYILIIAIMSVTGGLLTVWFVVREVRKSNLNNHLERILSLFGTLTGTLSTGLTLTRVVDPDFKTEAAQDIVLGAGVAVPFIIPFMASMIVPLIGLDKGMVNKYYIINLVALTVYTALLYLYWRYFSKKHLNKHT